MTRQRKTWTLAHGRKLDVGPKALIMGILNVTPDSFSDGGRYLRHDDAVAHGLDTGDRALVASGRREIVDRLATASDR